MAKMNRKTKVDASIPNSSMADIAFLLLIFFMVSTVFVTERGIKVTLPEAEAAQKIPRTNAATIYMNSTGFISIDDFGVAMTQVAPIMSKKLSDNYALITAFRTDKRTEYSYMLDIMEELKVANCLRVSFETKLEQ